MSLMILTICSSIFIFAIVAIVASNLMRDKIKVTHRVDSLTTMKESRIPFDNDRNKKSFINKISWLFEGKGLKKIENQLSLAAIPLRAEEFIVIWGMVTLVPASLVALFGFNIFVCTALIAIGLTVPPFWLHSAWKKRMALFDRQLGDALSIIGNSLRAGFSFNQSIESIAREMPDPIAKEFAKTIREIRLGLSLDKALLNMVERLNNGDLELIVSAVLIQRQVGGNLSEILDNIAETIKERLKLKGDIKVLTSSGRISGSVVGMLPVFIMGILMLINPGYVGMFFNSTIGRGMLVLGCILEVTGFLIVRKIVDIKF